MSTPDNTTTLMTKVLLPRRRDDVLTRQRLLNDLYDMVDYRLALVSAPAGYGKTTLLVDFATDLEHPVCWYALDASDHDPRLFLERLVASVRHRFPDFGAETLRAIAASADLGGGAPSVVRILVNEIVTRISRWFVLVLDDYHALGRSPEVDGIISNFVAYQRDQCLTVIASRTVPNLPLIIPLVARGGVGGIGPDQMRFLPEEVRDLFAHNYGTELTLADAAALADQSEGWITGLLLTAYTRWQGVLQSWMRARDSREPVYDYLAQEVYNHQPVEMQQFLGASSTLDEMNATLCREILQAERASDLLQVLETENLFVTHLENDWYRYHHLFREFLQSRFRHRDEAAWRALHRRAAEWFEAHGQTREAVAHYLAVGDEASAAELMAQIALDLYVSGQLTTLMTWRDKVRDEVLVAQPRLALYQSRAAYKLGRREAALGLTELAELGYLAARDGEGLVYTLLHRCQIWLAQGRADVALGLATSTLALIEQEHLPVGHEAHRVLGLAFVDRGDLQQAYGHLRQALELSDAQSTPYAQALARTGLALCISLMGQLHDAVRLNREAVAIWRRVGSDAGLADELNDLGFHLYALGEYDEAMGCLQEALALSRQTGLRHAEAAALVNLGELTRDLVLLDQAADYLDQGHRLARAIDDAFLIAYSLEAQGLVLLAQERYPEAVAAIESALALAIAQKSDYQTSRYRASLAVARVESGAIDAGLSEIEAATALLATIGSPTELHRGLVLKAWVLHRAGRSAEAVALVGQLLDTLPAASELQVFISVGKPARALLMMVRKSTEADSVRAQRIKAILQRFRELERVVSRLYPLATAPKRAAGPALRVYGFGSGRVELGGEAIPPSSWGSVTARQLLFYMLVHGARSREQIVADLWPELSAQKAKTSFHTTKFRLNRALGRDVVDFDGHFYTLHPDLEAWFDVALFRALLRTWRETQDVDALERATELYAGDFVTDCYSDWCELEREALRVRCMEALETLAERLVSRRQYRRAIRALRQALTLDPTRETFHQQLMRAYALSGDRSSALAQYERCAAELREGLGAAPSQATVQLYERILREVPLD
ncbi:MAG: tetratricopeptide repeat protein [Anaerolineae bacterium]|nr:tetratricopeptide repeat protein [Anaerolineae bacterium]